MFRGIGSIAITIATVIALNLGMIQGAEARPTHNQCVPIQAVTVYYNPHNPTVNTPVDFGSIIYPTNASGPIIFNWYFGDGYYGDGEDVTHTYGAPGNYFVRVSAENPCSRAETTVEVQVTSIVYLPFVAKGQ